MKELFDGLDRIQQVVHALASDVHELVEKVDPWKPSTTAERS